MMDTLGKIKEFVNYVRHTLKGYEKGEDQFFYEHLFQAYGHKGCREAGAQTQYAQQSPGEHTKFLDLVWRPRLLIEMKSRGKNLGNKKYHQQAFEYWDKLTPKPRYVVLCNFDEFWIYDTTLQIEEPVNRVKLEELPQRYAALNFLFPGNSAVDDRRGNYYENIPLSGAVQLFGREQELERLHQLLTPPALLIKGREQQNKLTIAAIVGMGGVGKTELAIQYAWHHLQSLADGAGGVCWVDARDGDVGIQLVNFARSLLNLNPPEDWDLPTQLKYCWRNWQPGDWLIVIDDVTNYRQQVKPYLPPESSQFKVLLTTREELGRPVEHLAINKLQPEAALDLLTSLVGVQRIQQESDIAEQLCQWLDYLPLGLELVGRYLERDPDLSLKTMLSLLEKKRLRHRSVLEADSTMTAKLGVADAFELSWERLEENAQFLGCLLSLFASADIPWDLVKLAYSNLPSSENEEIDLDILEEARANLVRFNLLQRMGEGSYRLHQLIREFLREKREQSAQVNDLKQAFVAAMVVVAKQIPDSPTRQQIQLVAPAMLHVAEVAENRELKDLLNDEDLGEPYLRLGFFYAGQGVYNQALPWLEQCLSVTQAHFGSNHPDVALSLHNLAYLYRLQGRYNEAESFYLQGLKIYENLPKNDCFSRATILNNLALVYKIKRLYSEAEFLYLQALELGKQFSAEDRPIQALTLMNIAALYRDKGQYDKAEPLHLQALELCKGLRGEKHLDVAFCLYNLANLYSDQKRYSEAEPLYIQTLELRKSLLGEEHPDVAATLLCLAGLHHDWGRFAEAEWEYLQALELLKRFLGEEHPDTATCLHGLAILYDAQNRCGEAESLFLQALNTRKRLLGEDHPDVADSLHELSHLYYSQNLYIKAEPLLVQAVKIRQRQLGANHPDTVNSLNGLLMVRECLNSTARDLPNFNQKAKKGNSKKKPKGFGKG
jgi:tetratricopeptide (TPR) repeat protein